MKAKALGKLILSKIWENRSNIEFVAGNIMVVAGTGMIMSKAEEAVEVKHEMERQIKTIELKDENDDWDDNGQRTKACLKMAKDTGMGYLKCYGPGVGVEVGGLVLMGISHATDRSELVSVSAALASTSMEFMQYRQRVRDELGEEKENKLYLGNKCEIVNEDGTVSIDEDALPSHVIAFTRNHPHWSDDPIINQNYAESMKRWLNMELQKEGIVHENDIRRKFKGKVDPAAEGWGMTAVDDDGNTNYIDIKICDAKGNPCTFADSKGNAVEFLFVLNGMEPHINSKIYRLVKYYRDWDCELKG